MGDKSWLGKLQIASLWIIENKMFYVFYRVPREKHGMKKKEGQSGVKMDQNK